jgi:hypothetical protein
VSASRLSAAPDAGGGATLTAVTGSVLGIDFGTSNTAAALHRGGQPVPLLFDGSPLLPSAICLAPDASLLVGRDAERMAGVAPERFEPNPKRRIDDGTVWLGERGVPVADAIAAVLHRVGQEAARVGGGPAQLTVLTHPAAWAGPRTAILAAAAVRAGLGPVQFVPEPVAAAAYFTTVLGRQVPPGHCLVVYDFGGGTFDVAVVQRTAGGFDVLATDGLPDVGGLDLDAAIVGQLRAGTAHASDAWGRLDWPQTAADRRAIRLLWQDVRAAKEQLSRHPTAALHIPLADVDRHVTREEFEKLVHPLLDRTVQVTLSTLRASGAGRESVRGVFLVGGSSRVPLAAGLLHRAVGIAPTILEQPELVVASGAPYAVRSPVKAPAVPNPAFQPAPAPQPVPAPAPPTTPPPPAPAGPVAPISMGTVLARIGLLALVLGVALPWAQDENTKPPFGFTHVSMSIWPAVVVLVAIVAAVLALRVPFPWRVVPAAVAGVAALAFLVTSFAVLGDDKDLKPVLSAFRDSSNITAYKVVIFLAMAGVGLPALAPWLRPAPDALLGNGLAWARRDAGRRLTKRLLALTAAVLATVNLVALLFRVGPDWDQWAIATTSDEANVVPSSAFMVIAVLFIAVTVEHAATVESGRHQRWLNPVRALVLVAYAVTLGGGSGFLYWVDTGSVAGVPWLAPIPAVLAAAACVITPRPPA